MGRRSALPEERRCEVRRTGSGRDIEIRKMAPEAATGPETWLPIFREAEQLIRVDLWPAVKAVAHELVRNPEDLHNADVAALASAAPDLQEDPGQASDVT